MRLTTCEARVALNLAFDGFPAKELHDHLDTVPCSRGDLLNGFEVALDFDDFRDQTRPVVRH